MSANTKIEWADHTFNPWIGCTQVGPGCDNCYAKADFDDRRHRVAWGAGQPRSRTKTWGDPVKWNRQHEVFFAQHGRRQRVFCASLADVFDNEVPDDWFDDLMRLIRDTPHLDWLLLTKRIGNVIPKLNGYCDRNLWVDSWDALQRPPKASTLGYQNVWIGATIVNQLEAERDIPKLLEVPTAKRFLSMEPLLGPVQIDRRLIAEIVGGSQHGQRFIDWVIVGGESGPKARPMHPDWARSLRDQCVAAGVPFLFKQWGEHDLSYDRERDDSDYQRCDRMDKLPGRWINLAGGHGFNGERVHYAHRVGKKAAGRMLDRRTWDEVPT